MAEINTPDTIYCPKCGKEISMETVEDAPTKVKLQNGGYVTGARGNCPCGVTSVLAMKKMPENPTFTLMFNIYKFTLDNRGKPNG